jgi:PST family polysaccharide transporter
VNYWARSLDNILVGRFLGPASLGYYSVAYRIMQYPLQAVSGLIGRVLFPTMAKLQDDSQLFRSVYLKTLGYISLFTFPAMIGLCVVTRPFVHTFLSARWEPVIVPLAILALVGGNQSIATNTGNIYMAKGRTDTMFRVGLLSSAIYLTGIIAGLKWGIVGVSIGYAIADAVATPIDYFFASRLLGASLHTLIAPTVRPLFCSVVMALSVLAATGPVLRSVGVVAGLVVLSAVGMLTYSVATWFFNRKQVLEFISVIGGVRA